MNMDKEYVISELANNPSMTRPMCFYAHVCAKKAVVKAKIPVPVKPSFYKDTQPFKEIYLCETHRKILKINAADKGMKVKTR